jgi:hypothetical protein
MGITEQNLIYALSQVKKGRTAYDVADELGTNRETLGRRLRELPEYRAHRQKLQSEDLVCPNCEGALVKQELYFWQCKCGVEFWPDEDSIPDNPDEWQVTPLAKLSGQGDALIMIKDLHNRGKMIVEIVEVLNAAGHKTPRGTAWSRNNLSGYMKRHKVAGNDYTAQREQVLGIVEAMAGKQGISCKGIAERLNVEGYRTSRNQPWSMSAVNKLIRDTLKLDVNLYRTDALMPAREKTGKGKGGQDHPWSRAEHARIQRGKEWQRFRQEGKK